jgi:hypothetical protein
VVSASSLCTTSAPACNALTSITRKSSWL